MPLLNLENLFHFGVADDGFAMFRIEQAGHRFFDLVDQLVNDAVKFDLDAFAFCGGHGLAFDLDVETDDDRVRCARQQHVGLRNRPDAGVNDLQIDLLAFDLAQRADQRFERTLRVALQNDAQDFLPVRPLRADFRAWRVAARSIFRRASGHETFFAQSLGGALRFHDEKFVAGVRQPGKTENLHRR